MDFVIVTSMANGPVDGCRRFESATISLDVGKQNPAVRVHSDTPMATIQDVPGSSYGYLMWIKRTRR